MKLLQQSYITFILATIGNFRSFIRIFKIHAEFGLFQGVCETFGSNSAVTET
ncbi:hypothetical protein [Porphyromonas crevioricanis]|uniref:Uncharacterized protein n=2 Tax=Porphyromonas crevioricanis TaxID=393921 RepID=A0A2X4PNH1_9PORP|nr:hypothetical protein [Porphyromonas crevioricanis]GAD06016.1 hypothetical protein PORCRE_1736 [Porphyromonas crevioricanis JCM 15906]GAD06435.1 hypothetical protein PORCAN_31 [Porphyromonas crevioricanis JCM 13913]SJZ57189.1 hypothetical protein SAMN02745203_00201 [Porphyromonas crevioricanis]SQH73403.1 Uncharacterised protein [Porphyromonas crevioricanis]